MDNVTLHSGSAYMISRATCFPGYFLKEKGCETAIARSTATFRNICPALGIPIVLVGSEPFCPSDRASAPATFYTIPKRSGPVIEVVELARVEKNGAAISAFASENPYTERTGRR